MFKTGKKIDRGPAGPERLVWWAKLRRKAREADTEQERAAAQAALDADTARAEAQTATYRNLRRRVSDGGGGYDPLRGYSGGAAQPWLRRLS